MRQHSSALERKWNRQLTRPIFLAGTKNTVWKRDWGGWGGGEFQPPLCMKPWGWSQATIFSCSCAILSCNYGPPNKPYNFGVYWILLELGTRNSSGKYAKLTLTLTLTQIPLHNVVIYMLYYRLLKLTIGSHLHVNLHVIRTEIKWNLAVNVHYKCSQRIKMSCELTKYQQINGT